MPFLMLSRMNDDDRRIPAALVPIRCTMAVVGTVVVREKPLLLLFSRCFQLFFRPVRTSFFRNCPSPVQKLKESPIGGTKLSRVRKRAKIEVKVQFYRYIEIQRTMVLFDNFFLQPLFLSQRLIRKSNKNSAIAFGTNIDIEIDEALSNGHCHPPYPPYPGGLPLTVFIVRSSWNHCPAAVPPWRDCGMSRCSITPWRDCWRGSTLL